MGSTSKILVEHPENPGQLINVRSKLVLWKEDEENICYLCLKPFKDIDEATIDHVIPRGKGGENCIDNIELCCEKCNNHKSDMMPEDYGIPEKKTDEVEMKWDGNLFSAKRKTEGMKGGLE